MSPRTGRPTDAPKRERIGIRLTSEEEAKLKICCEKLYLTKTEVIREGIQKMYEQAIKQK